MSTIPSFFKIGLVLLIIIPFLGCPVNNNGGGSSDQEGGSSDQETRVLYVNLSNGVTGIPAEDTYQYDEDTTVDYNYSLKPGYRDLKVKLEGDEVPASGSFTVGIGYHTLGAESTKMYDIRGRWTGFQDFIGFRFFLDVTFSGEYLAGEATGTTDQIEVYSGKGDYTVSGDETEIEFSLNFSGYGIIFHFKGFIEGKNKMSGTYTTQPSQWFGPWELTR